VSKRCCCLQLFGVEIDIHGEGLGDGAEHARVGREETEEGVVWLDQERRGGMSEECARWTGWMR